MDNFTSQNHNYEDVLDLVSNPIEVNDHSRIDNGIIFLIILKIDVFSWFIMNSDFLATPENRNSIEIKNEEISPLIMNDKEYLHQPPPLPEINIYNQSPTSDSEVSNSSPSIDVDEQKKLERLIKNREIARSCRKRKKEKLADMEEEVKRLKQENQMLTLDLQGQLYNVPEKEDKRLEQLNMIRELMENNGSEQELKIIMDQYAEEWSDYGNDRRGKIQFHIEKLKQLLLPLRVFHFKLDCINI